MSLDADWPTKRNPEYKDREPYYAEQRRLREIEQKRPLTDFGEAAERDFAARTARPILSIDKELK